MDEIYATTILACDSLCKSEKYAALNIYFTRLSSLAICACSVYRWRNKVKKLWHWIWLL